MTPNPVTSSSSNQPQPQQGTVETNNTDNVNADNDDDDDDDDWLSNIAPTPLSEMVNLMAESQSPSPVPLSALNTSNNNNDSSGPSMVPSSLDASKPMLPTTTPTMSSSSPVPSLGTNPLGMTAMTADGTTRTTSAPAPGSNNNTNNLNNSNAFAALKEQQRSMLLMQHQQRQQQQQHSSSSRGMSSHQQPNLMDPDILSLQLRMLQQSQLQNQSTQPMQQQQQSQTPQLPQQQQQQRRHPGQPLPFPKLQQQVQQAQQQLQQQQQQQANATGTNTTSNNTQGGNSTVAAMPRLLSSTFPGAGFWVTPGLMQQQQQQSSSQAVSVPSLVTSSQAPATSSNTGATTMVAPGQTAQQQQQPQPFLLPSTMMPPSVLASVCGSGSPIHRKKRPNPSTASSPSHDKGLSASDNKSGNNTNKEAKLSASRTSSPTRKSAFSDVKPQEYVNRILQERGYGEALEVRISADKAGYDTTPSPLQLASFGTELVKAVHTSDVQKLGELLSCGLSPNPCNQFRDSVVDLVCKRGNEAVFACLVEHGCNLRVCDGFGRTPLHHCCWASDFSAEIAKTIIDRDWQQLFMEDKRGQTPLEYVRESRAGEWITFLETHCDEFWPVGGQPPVVVKSLKEERADGALPDPDVCLPVPLAAAVSAGKVTPEQVRGMTEEEQQTLVNG